MFKLAKKLFPICRSLTGNGNRKTLNIIKEIIPQINIREVASGKKFSDWKVPLEWNVNDAYISSNGKKIVDFKKNNLHLVGYSLPVDKNLSKRELKKNLFYLKKQKNLIPYITSYYNKTWGFCISYNDFLKKFKSNKYRVKIDSSLKKGSLTYGEFILKGKSKKEILISCNICHPSMANNEISGMVVSTELIKFLKKRKNFYTYRFVFIPETIGSIIYINKNFKKLKSNTVAGFVLTCIGDEKNYSYLESRNTNTLSDRSTLNFLKFEIKKFKRYSFLQRGSDERQYCSPNVDLPICSLMKSKYNTYKEYHTSGDNLNFISQKGLLDGFKYVKSILMIIENNFYYKSKFKGEPNLGSRNLYPKISSKKNSPLSSGGKLKSFLDFLAYADGKNDLIDISDKIGISALRLIDIKNKLLKLGLIKQE